MIRFNSLRTNMDKQINIVAPINNEWNVKSGCHFSCIEQSMGIQIISSNLDQSTNIQLCHAEFVVSYPLHTSNTYFGAHKHKFFSHVIKSKQHKTFPRVYVKNFKKKSVVYRAMERR